MRLIILAFLLTSLISWAETQSAKFSATELGNRWWQHDQFGIFYDAGNSWYYHIDHGWIYVDQWRDNGTWLFLPLKDKMESNESNSSSSINEQVALGWMWSKAEHYPRLYNNELEDWMYFNKDRNESKYYCYSLQKYLWEDFIIKTNTPPEHWKLLEILFFVDDYEASETDLLPDIDLAYAGYFNVTIPKEELATDDKWSSLFQSIQEDENVRKKIGIRKIEEDESNYFIKFRSGNFLPFYISASDVTVVDSNNIREYNPEIKILATSDQVKISDIADEKYKTALETLTKAKVAKEEVKFIPVSRSWDEQYHTKWIINPARYGGLATLEKIKEAKDSGATELELGAVPPEYATIYISDVTPLSELTNLKKLSLFNTYNVQNIEPLSTLVNLTELTLTSNTISDLSPIEKLTNLEILSLQECGITDDDLESLSKLPNLKELNLRENEILDPSPLAEFPSLKILAFGGSGSDIDQYALTGLAKLSNLEELDLSYSWGYLDDSQKLALEEALPNTTIIY